MEKMEIKHTEEGSIDIISIEGDLDLYGAPLLREKLNGLKSKGRDKIILNMENVPYIDSSGLGLLLKSMINGKIPYLFANLNTGIKHIFKMSGYKQVTTVYDTVEEAKNAFKNQ
ncbi:MAG: STAS domain-containing protein [Leptospiraceae bacterium]|nr:STAS domain-containing protein [Leptospiraceae bacterium]